MKRILVTGAAGAIGQLVIKYLLSEGKYEITALDLKNKKVYKRLRRYRKRINIVYGDVLDRTLIENLVKDQDIIIQLSSCMPPLSEYKEELANITEYNGTENIIRAISYYNPKCFLLYASTTSLYGNKEGSVDTKLNIQEEDYFNHAKYKTEKLIQKKMKNYCILRVPLVLSDLRNESFIYSIKAKDQVEVISKEDAAYAFCKAIDKMSAVNEQIFNIGGGETCRCEYKDLLNSIIKYHGLSWKFVVARTFMNKECASPVLLDSDESNKILKYRNDSLQSYYMRQKRRSKKRAFSKMLGKIYLSIKGGQ